MFESRKILSLPQLDISAQCCRVGVAVGHYENAWITFEKPADLAKVGALLSKAPFVKWFEGASGEGLTALAAVHHRDLALVGRARLDGRGTLCLTVVGDNLRLGAATTRCASRAGGSSPPTQRCKSRRNRHEQQHDGRREIDVRANSKARGRAFEQ